MNPIFLIDQAIRLDFELGLSFTICAVTHDYTYFGICDKDNMPEWFTEELAV